MEDTLRKPGAAKAAESILLISTLGGFIFALFSLFSLVKVAENVRNGLSLDSVIMLVTVLAVSGGGLVFNTIGFVGKIMLQKKRKGGLHLAKLWAIAMIVIFAIAIFYILLILMLLPRISNEAAAAIPNLQTAILLSIANASWQWELGILVIILLALKPVKAFYNAQASGSASPEAAGV